MPQVIDGFDWGEVRPNQIYPWDQWIRLGVTQRFVHGQDFQTSARNFMTQLRRAAWQRGYQTEATRDKISVTARFEPRTDEGWRDHQKERDRDE